ncbi:hypothetical protein [Polynucleobacter sp. MWH-UH2A]|uniref:hypothetical protein n=1 Tax=Polynucleobacter sp. MWH-UH2A TaxID=1855617 RepID=UPI001BFE0208|nr:hypothetical protein [Polynucleobacter sp. MWH-UH2A]QWD64597.1 hypothetical protein IC571_02910 [Polynucleobacter sp. MWH-UH2A]
MLHAKPVFLSKYCLGLMLACFVSHGAYASSDHHDPAPAKAGTHKGTHKFSNDKDIVLRKNAQSTLYLLSGWGKTEGPYVWYTVSAHFNADQLSPDGKPFNLFSLSGALDCKENHFFFYRTSYMYFDSKTKSLNEVFFKKSKSDVIQITPETIESSVKAIICNE